MPAAFVFDPNRCTGCQACELACSIENDLGPDRSWREVITFNADAVPGLPRFHLSLACNHCSEPACMYACPALAYERDTESGAVLLEPDRCIGCRYCSWACPYGAPRFEEARGVMGKCTFCAHRLRDGLEPACATLCPTGALGFADLPASELDATIAGFPQTDLGPSIRIEPALRTVRRDPGATRERKAELVAPTPDVPSPGVSLRSEWSLAAFTFLTALLFAGFIGAVGGALRWSPIVFAGVAALAAAFSLSHLGRPARAWRAGLNLRRSWLSREVTAFGAFVAGGVIVLASGDAVGWAATAGVAFVGLLTLVSADQVYRPVYSGTHPVLDGGGTLLTGLYLAGLLLGNPWLAGVAGSIKLGSEGLRAVRVRGGPAPRARALSIPRALLAFVLPAIAWIASGVPLPGWALLAAIVGEALGRVEFYNRLRVRSPTVQARTDLALQLVRTTS